MKLEITPATLHPCAIKQLFHALRIYNHQTETFIEVIAVFMKRDRKRERGGGGGTHLHPVKKNVYT